LLAVAVEHQVLVEVLVLEHIYMEQELLYQQQHIQ
jgi:hypothetical protein